MERVVFVGDELSAAGWRLAGLHTVVAENGVESKALAAAREGAALVLLGAGCAARIAAAELNAALLAGAPLLLVVPDAAGDALPADLAVELRTELGMDQ